MKSYRLHAARFVYLESLLLIQSPGKAVFCIFYLKAKVGQGVSDLVAGSPVLVGFGLHALFKQHVYYPEDFFASDEVAKRLTHILSVILYLQILLLSQRDSWRY